MRKSIDNAILAAFIADSLALGVHWVYDTTAITARYGQITGFLTPELAPYHHGKTAGQLTHYGDQMLLLLEHVSDNAGFHAEQFSAAWLNMMRSYSGYMDQASKKTITNLEAGTPALQAGSTSDDLSGAVRFAPLLAAYAHQTDKLIQSARVQASLTHNSPLILATAELLARATSVILQGVEPAEALSHAGRNIGDFMVADLVNRGLAARKEESVHAVKQFGQSCSVQGALPSAVQIVARHGNDLRTALTENVMAGGDSAARGILIATLVAAQPEVHIPQEWIEGFHAFAEVTALLQAIP